MALESNLCSICWRTKQLQINRCYNIQTVSTLCHFKSPGRRIESIIASLGCCVAQYHGIPQLWHLHLHTKKISVAFECHRTFSLKMEKKLLRVGALVAAATAATAAATKALRERAETTEKHRIDFMQTCTVYAVILLIHFFRLSENRRMETRNSKKRNIVWNNFFCVSTMNNNNKDMAEWKMPHQFIVSYNRIKHQRRPKQRKNCHCNQNTDANSDRGEVQYLTFQFIIKWL